MTKYSLQIIVLILSLHSLIGSEVNQDLYRLPIIIKGKALPDMLGYPIKHYAAFQFKITSDGKKNFSPIPFQIDEVNRNGNYVLENGIGYTRNTDDGYFDKNDELVIMGTDLGEKVPSKNDLPKGLPIHEVKVSQPNGEKALYFYMVYDPMHKLDRSTVTYVKFDKEMHIIRTNQYAYYFKPDNYLLMDKVVFGNKEVLSGSQYLYFLNFKYFFAMTFRSKEFGAFLEEWRVGPIRAILAIGVSYKTLFKELKTNLFSEVSFFVNQVTFPTTIEFPFDASTYFHPASGIFYGIHLKGGTYETNVPHLTTPEKAKRIKNSFGKYPYIIGKKDSSTVFVRMYLENDVVETIIEPQLYDVKRPPAGEVLDSRSWLGDVKTPLGLFIDLSTAQKREYHLNVDFFFDANRYKDSKKYFINYRKPSVKSARVYQ